ncbi:beta-L-arabinofuranosidase domain-containing protein [Maribacter sp. 2307ULW6-5]|uniref:glycoside hydrolase family 127 protein n=1 Tax=Maribacter sp. 2307ULW6-5 TaxID=3386275 RepID=UPI0039BCD5E7
MLFCGFQIVAQQKESFYPITPVRFTEVEVTDSFWKERMKVNREVTIPIAFQRSEESGRIKNFRVAAGLEEGTYNTGRGYDDSDVYKVMEGAAYSLSQQPDPELEKYLDSLITIVGMAQEDDGYLFTVKTILGVSDAHRDAKQPKWVEVEKGSHELYNVGHMYEAAVAHYKATGKRNFLDIAIKSADLIDKEFGWGKRELVPGHQEIEIGLAKLYEVTGEKRYLDLAKFFLDKRGKSPRRETYDQTHLPVIEQEKAVGHSVRAAYMYTAMADMAALTKDKAYIGAMDKLWHDIVDTKLYIIGGIGAAGGHEGFGDHYELPNLRAYNETCAGIANVFWNYRLFLTHGDAKYMDVLERSLYNNVLSGVSLEGDKFFYPNRLESRGNEVRSEWFGTSCCPSNVSRFIPDVPGYVYAQNEDAIYVNLFISSNTVFSVKRKKVELDQTSQLPWSGKVDFRVKPDAETAFSLRIRIPGWATEKPVPSDLYAFGKTLENKTEIFVNGEEVSYDMEKGFAVVERKWAVNDHVRIEFPFEVRTITAHPNIKENQGKVALQAGPMVYCIEGFDMPNGATNHIMVNPAQDFSMTYQKDLLNGVLTVNGKADFLYRTATGTIEKQEVGFSAIPYFAWANRGASDMEVWLPTKESAATPMAYPKATYGAMVSASKKQRLKNLYAVNDSYIPSKENNDEVPDFNFWPLKKSTEWIQMDFEKPQTFTTATVYWQKSKDGGVVYPKSWKLFYKDGQNWKVVNTRKYPINEDGLPSKISFKEVTSNTFKLEIKLAEKPAGLYEWELN